MVESIAGNYCVSVQDFVRYFWKGFLTRFYPLAVGKLDFYFSRMNAVSRKFELGVFNLSNILAIFGLLYSCRLTIKNIQKLKLALILNYIDLWNISII